MFAFCLFMASTLLPQACDTATILDSFIFTLNDSFTVLSKLLQLQAFIIVIEKQIKKEKRKSTQKNIKERKNTKKIHKIIKMPPKKKKKQTKKCKPNIIVVV